MRASDEPHRQLHARNSSYEPQPCVFLAPQFAGEALRVQNVPAVVLSPAIGVVVGSIRGLLPW